MQKTLNLSPIPETERQKQGDKGRNEWITKQGEEVNPCFRHSSAGSDSVHAGFTGIQASISGITGPLPIAEILQSPAGKQRNPPDASAVLRKQVCHQLSRSDAGHYFEIPSLFSESGAFRNQKHRVTSQAMIIIVAYQKSLSIQVSFTGPLIYHLTISRRSANEISP